MSQVKLPYHPETMATATMTNFGTPEVDLKDIYEKGVPNKTIVKLDQLDCLHQYLSPECFIYRELLYRLITSYNSDEECLQLLAGMYKRHKSITKFVNKMYLYGDITVPLGDRVISFFREEVTNFRNESMTLLSDAGGKFLLDTHLLYYFAFNKTSNIPKQLNVEVIC